MFITAKKYNSPVGEVYLQLLSQFQKLIGRKPEGKLFLIIEVKCITTKLNRNIIKNRQK